MGRDYFELRLKIRGKYHKMSDFAKAMGMTSATLSKKLMGESEWKREEMVKAAELLDLSPEDILRIFFNI